jgi:hypothetical protein
MADPENQKQAIETEASPCFRRIVVDNMVCYVSSIGLRALVYSDYAEPKKVLPTKPTTFEPQTIKRTIECELIMSPEMLKSIHRLLGEYIDRYEYIYSKTPNPQDVESRRKEYNKMKQDKGEVWLGP